MQSQSRLDQDKSESVDVNNVNSEMIWKVINDQSYGETKYEYDGELKTHFFFTEASYLDTNIKFNLLNDENILIVYVAKAYITIIDGQKHPIRLGIHHLDDKAGHLKNLFYEYNCCSAVNHNDGRAYYNLGQCYENGWGISKNISEAQVAFKTAFNLGYQQAAKVFDKLEPVVRSTLIKTGIFKQPDIEEKKSDSVTLSTYVKRLFYV